MTYFWVFVGGGLGSMVRFGIGKLALTWAEEFPLGTFVSNTLACLLLAAVVFILPEKLSSEFWFYFLAVGFCGGFSTFSTFGLELFKFFQNGQYWMAGTYLICSIAACLFLFWMLSQKVTHP